MSGNFVERALPRFLGPHTSCSRYSEGSCRTRLRKCGLSDLNTTSYRDPNKNSFFPSSYNHQTRESATSSAPAWLFRSRRAVLLDLNPRPHLFRKVVGFKDNDLFYFYLSKRFISHILLYAYTYSACFLSSALIPRRIVRRYISLTCIC